MRRKFFAISLLREMVGEAVCWRPLGLVLPEVLLEEVPLREEQATSSELFERGLLMMVEPDV